MHIKKVLTLYTMTYPRFDKDNKALCKECGKWISLYDSVINNHVCEGCR